MKYLIKDVRDRLVVGTIVNIYSYGDTALIRDGYIGEVRDDLFLVWNNTMNGTVGSIDPRTMGYKYSWTIGYNEGSYVEFIYEPSVTVHSDKIINIFTRKK